MSVEALFQRGPGNTLMPLDPVGVTAIQGLTLGQAVKVTIVQPRNVKLLRKFFSLMNLGFDYWEPEEKEWKGIKAEKSFEVFREQVTIMAGYREVTYNLDGSVKVTAKSISFASMKEEEFQLVYKAVFNVIWRMVICRIAGFTEELMENAVYQLQGYD